MEKVKVLIAEDEVIVAKYIAVELEAIGCQICGLVTNAEDVIPKALEYNPDVIIMDINLNGEQDGIEILTTLFQTKVFQIIFMTGYTDKELKDKANKLSPLAFLEKPIEIYELVDVIEKINSSKD